MKITHTGLIGILGLCSATNVAAQADWCPPGAMWHLRDWGMAALMQVQGQAVYDGDEVVDGRVAQRIVVDYTGTSYPGAPIQSVHDTVRTSIDGDAVLIHDHWGSAGWDTLYWFGASVGDHWHMPYTPDAFCGPQYLRMDVIAANTVSLNGITLRKVTVEYWSGSYWNSGAPYMVQAIFTERIQTPLGSLIPACLIVCGGVEAYSYEDPQIGYFPLLFSMDLNEAPTLPITLVVREGELFIQSDAPTLGELSVFEPGGQSIYSSKVNSSTVNIPFTNWSAGLYLVQFTQDTGRRSVLRWFKP